METNTLIRGAGAVKDAPLTNEIMDRLMTDQKIASEVATRLFELRDRLFGSQPTGNGAGATARAVGSSFADTYNERAQDLRSILLNIESLSAELANRL